MPVKLLDGVACGDGGREEEEHSQLRHGPNGDDVDGDDDAMMAEDGEEERQKMEATVGGSAERMKIMNRIDTDTL